MLPLINAAVFSFAVGTAKPDPAIYRVACTQLGVSPEECAFAGDGGGRELDGAAALGMIAVWIDQPRNAAWGAMTSTVFHHRLAGVADLPVLLERLTAGARN
jgi:putative hydrolase of the HAD superfamily